jgi:hypothetical protein
MWTVRTLVTALRTHMLTKSGEIGGLYADSETRKRLARKSRVSLC